METDSDFGRELMRSIPRADETEPAQPEAGAETTKEILNDLKSRLQSASGSGSSRGSIEHFDEANHTEDHPDPVAKARSMTFEKTGFPIKETDEIVYVMEFIRDAVRRVESELRADRRVEHSDLISQVIELKSQVEDLANRQAGIVATLKPDLKDALAEHRKSLLEMLKSAFSLTEQRVQKSIADGIKGADDGFKAGLRSLVNNEVRVAVGKGFEQETELMTEARNDWAGRLNKAADKTIQQLEAATREKTARMSKGWIQNAVDDFMGLSSSTQYIVIGVFATFVVTSILF